MKNLAEERQQKLRLLIELMQEFLWAGPDVRRMLNEQGMDLIASNFYSNIPSIQEIENSFEYKGDKLPYDSSEIFDPEFMLERLKVLGSFCGEFNPPQDGDEENADSFFWGNSQFGYSDAMAQYTMLRLVRPDTILEVGSGFSTLISIEAVKKNGKGRVVCIEPFPRSFLKHNSRIELLEKPVQDFDEEYFNTNLKDGDVLFIDSTHTVKTGSDCLHLYLRVLPRLKAGIKVHVHDVFLPQGYPQPWILEKQIFWTEQYLLLALLQDVRRYKVLYGSNYHWLFNREALERFMQGKRSAGGGSLWFEIGSFEGINDKPSKAS